MLLSNSAKFILKILYLLLLFYESIVTIQYIFIMYLKMQSYQIKMHTQNINPKLKFHQASNIE